MPRGQISDNFDDDAGPKPGLWLRFQNAIVKPDESPPKSKEPDKRSVEQIEAEIDRTNDKERAFGLIAAPLAALIAIIVGGDQISHARSLHESVSTFEELLWVLAGMSVLMMATTLLRKRLFQGILTALFGLGVFNLHYWGFGVPFVMLGAWLLVRSYRLSQALKLAGGSSGSQSRNGNTERTRLARPNKRYTPQTAPARRPAKPKPNKEQKAG